VLLSLGGVEEKAGQDAAALESYRQGLAVCDEFPPRLAQPGAYFFALLTDDVARLQARLTGASPPAPIFPTLPP
jgi:hypothetical protein